MTRALIIVGLFILLCLCIPTCIKVIRKRLAPFKRPSSDALQVISVIAVGPQQRVITLEAGPIHARTWITVGVTAQAINFLHSAPLASFTEITSPISKNNTVFNVPEHG